MESVSEFAVFSNQSCVSRALSFQACRLISCKFSWSCECEPGSLQIVERYHELMVAVRSARQDCHKLGLTTRIVSSLREAGGTMLPSLQELLFIVPAAWAYLCLVGKASTFAAEAFSMRSPDLDPPLCRT